MSSGRPGETGEWRQQAVEYAGYLSQVKWTPVADGMPMKGGAKRFEKGKEYTGVPYSSVQSVGRYIGFDVYLKTFLAAVRNPDSVLYAENLSGTMPNAGAYYGAVCSSFTSYALQCGIWFVSRHHAAPYRAGIVRVAPQSAQAAEPGDILFTPPPPGGHVELVTGVTRGRDGIVTHVHVQDSWPPTTRMTPRDSAGFDAHLKNKQMYRITDLDAWRGDNRADAFRFPNYAEDAATPAINPILLLDRGDWVAYDKDQPVRFHVMDTKRQGVRALVIRRGRTEVERVPLNGPDILKRSLAACGDYTAYCEMADGSQSPACEFAVCALEMTAVPDIVSVCEPWEIRFRADAMDAIMVRLQSNANPYAQHALRLDDRDRAAGRLAVPAGLIRDAGVWQVWLVGESRYGRLKQRRDIKAW